MEEDISKIKVHRPAAGQRQAADWADITLGHIVFDKKSHMHTVTGDQAGWIQLTPVSGPTGPVAMRRPTGAVEIYVPSDEEAMLVLSEALGDLRLKEIEKREKTIARALVFRTPPVPNNATAQRDHIDMMHGIYVNDVLNKHNGTKVNPTPRKRKAELLEELRNLHDEAHADPALWPATFPHTHGPIGGTS